jgi:hypothetical protein
MTSEGSSGERGPVEGGSGVHQLLARQIANGGWDFRAVTVWDLIVGRRPA